MNQLYLVDTSLELTFTKKKQIIACINSQYGLIQSQKLHMKHCQAYITNLIKSKVFLIVEFELTC